MNAGCACCGGVHPPPRADEWPEANCPPCQCVWCRDRRGETTDEERRQIEANARAHERFYARRRLREAFPPVAGSDNL